MVGLARRPVADEEVALYRETGCRQEDGVGQATFFRWKNYGWLMPSEVRMLRML
jgi:hypothetical protein